MQSSRWAARRQDERRCSSQRGAGRQDAQHAGRCRGRAVRDQKLGPRSRGTRLAGASSASSRATCIAQRQRASCAHNRPPSCPAYPSPSSKLSNQTKSSSPAHPPMLQQYHDRPPVRVHRASKWRPTLGMQSRVRRYSSCASWHITEACTSIRHCGYLPSSTCPACLFAETVLTEQ